MEIDILFKNNGLTSESIGLRDKFGYELSATVSNNFLQNECREFLKYVASYLSEDNVFSSGDTISYGSWLVKMVLSDSKYLVFWECNPENNNFVLGVNNSILCWREQHRICEKVEAIFTPPLLNQLVVISDGVYEGDDVEGVRYPSPAHMTGWWLTTDQYNGDVNTLKTVHLHHIFFERPDLIKFLALPNGYRFFSPQSDVWFDHTVD